MLVFDFQNNFSSISSAASVYCPFPRRSLLSLFIVIRMRRISSVEKVAFYRLGQNQFSVSVAPGFPCYGQVPLPARGFDNFVLARAFMEIENKNR